MLTDRWPVYATPFIGRTDELAEIAALLDDPNCRLLTVLGPGGIGKTRLAVEAASRLNGFADGVYFVPLQPINSVENLTAEFATALNLQFHALAEPEQQLLHFLKDKHLLLLLDNFEHLLDGAALVASVLQAAPRVKLLVTSRETLNLREEWVRSLDGLDYPLHTPTKALEEFNAIQLFIERVHEVRGDFSLAAEQEGVLRITQMVEGMPLALELAAARAKTLPCAVIVEEIQQSIDFLSASLRNLPERHRSMQAVFDWSWQLLSKVEQTAFMQLSVFRGSFRSDAGRELAGISLATLSALVEKSLLRLDVSGRYQFHELLRRFALGKLNEVPELRDDTLDAHCAYFAHFLSEREVEVDGPQMRSALKELEAEIANLRAAWDWAVEHKNFDALQRSYRTLAHLYNANSWFREGAGMFQAATAALRSGKRGKRRAVLLSNLLLQSAGWGSNLGQFDSAMEALQESLVIIDRIGDQRSMATVLAALSDAAYMQGNFVQTDFYAQEALAAATQIGDDLLVADAKCQLTNVCEASGKYGKAVQLLEEAQLIYRQHGMWVILSNTLAGLAAYELLQGDYERAKSHLQEAVTIAENQNNSASVGHAHELLGQVAHAVGDFDAASRHLQAGLQIARDLPFPRLIEWCLLHSGSLACARGEYGDARQAFQDVLTMTAAEGERWKQARAIAGLGRVAYLTGNIDEAEHYLTESLTRNTELGFQWGEAKTLNLLGCVAVAQGNFREAKKRFAEALQIGLNIETPRTLLETLVSVSELKTAEGDLDGAQELCVLCLQHPALDADTEAQAKLILGKLKPEATSTVVKLRPSPNVHTVAAHVLRQIALQQSGLPQRSSHSLTERELEILRLIAAGLSNGEIADQLVLAKSTIKWYINEIFSKLETNSRTQAVALARRRGLLT